MEKYFSLNWKDKSSSLVSAFAPDNTKLAYELIEDLEGKFELPFEFDLVKLSDTKNVLSKSDNLANINDIWMDYQPNSLAWPLMSQRMKDIIEKHLTANESLEWITAKVNGNGKQNIYYIPRFKNVLDVLDIEKTMFVTGTDKIIRPCFSLGKIKNYTVFHQPSSSNLWKITPQLYITELLKKAFIKDKLTGVEFENIRAV